jgi:hypothetical protein
MKNNQIKNILLQLKKDIDTQLNLLDDIQSDDIDLIESDTEREIELLKNNNDDDNIINDNNIEIKKIHLSKTKDYVKDYNKNRYANQENKNKIKEYMHKIVYCPICNMELKYYSKSYHIKTKH